MSFRNFLLSAFLLASVAAWAQPGGNGGGRRGPPPEAIEACSGKSEGDTCSFRGRRGDVTGQCRLPPNGGQGELACAPDRGRRR